jgi:hypothetical protein
MKYSIRISGYGNEISIGHIDSETKQKVLERFGEEESLESIFSDDDFIECGCFGIDDVYHNFSASEDFLLTILQDDKIIKEMTREEMGELDMLDHEEFVDVCRAAIDDDFAVVCVSGEKGEFFCADIEAEEFDISKLRIKMHCDVGTDFYTHGDMVGKVIYDEEELDNYGGDTVGKYFSVYISL